MPLMMAIHGERSVQNCIWNFQMWRNKKTRNKKKINTNEIWRKSFHFQIKIKICQKIEIDSAVFFFFYFVFRFEFQFASRQHTDPIRCWISLKRPSYQFTLYPFQQNHMAIWNFACTARRSIQMINDWYIHLLQLPWIYLAVDSLLLGKYWFGEKLKSMNFVYVSVQFAMNTRAIIIPLISFAIILRVSAHTGRNQMPTEEHQV